MREFILSLQHFAAGDVVNYAGGSNADYAGAYNTNLNQTIPNPLPDNFKGDLSVEMKTFYDKALLELAQPNLVHDQFAKKKPIPRNGGKSIEFRYFDDLPKALNAITEGVTPTGNKLVAHSMTAQVDQYGDYIEQTDLLELTAIDNTIVEATKKLANQAGQTLDTITRNELVGGTNKMYSRKDNGGGSYTNIDTRADITGACPLTVKDVFRAATELRSVNAPTIGGSYVAIIHPKVAYSLMMEAGDTWLGIQKYADPTKILRGEIGSLGGVRFVQSTEAKIYGPAVISDGLTRLTVHSDGASASTSLKVNELLTAGTYSGANKIPVYVNGTANYITAIANNTTYSTLTLESAVTVSGGKMVCGQGAGKDGAAVFCTLFLAEGGYATTELTGGGLQHIVKQLGYGNDPLNQRSSIGWKATKVAKRLLEQYILRFESGSADYSYNTDSN